MEKILLLGDSAQQLVAIRAAKELGYYTVVMDYLPDNPEQSEVDKFYGESHTNLEAVNQADSANYLSMFHALSEDDIERILD